MFNEILLELDKKLMSCDVDNKTLIKDRLTKMNEAYLYDLIVSRHTLENNGKKTILRRAVKQ